MNKVFFNGVITEFGNAQISIDSLSFTLGASVFEAIRVNYIKESDTYFVVNAKKHVSRLFNSMKILRMYPLFTQEDVCEGIRKIVGENLNKSNGYIRITAYIDSPSPGSSIFNPKSVEISFCITCTKKEEISANLTSIKCCVSSWHRISDNSLPPRVKSACNYENTRLAGYEAITNGYDNAIMLDSLGKVTEAAESTIFIVDNNGAICTPRKTNSILESMNREMIIDVISDTLQLNCEQREIDRTELYLAQEIFICNTAKLIRPVYNVDGLEINKEQIGEITKKIWDVYRKLLLREEVNEGIDRDSIIVKEHK